MESVKVGAPGEDVDICGLVSSMQFDKVKGMVDRAVAGGAKVECGGDTIPAGPKYAYQPTVLTGVKQSDEIVQEEIFGPVLPVLTFKTMDEAFELACDTKFGLTSSIYTTNVDIAERAKNELRFGETPREPRELRGHPGLPRGHAPERHRRRRRQARPRGVPRVARRVRAARPQRGN